MGDADVLPLAGDASFRRYFRVADHGRSAILMDAPPPHEDPRPFLDVAEWLTARGFPAPAIFGTDLTQGLVLLEDFGDARMRETVDAAPRSAVAAVRGGGRYPDPLARRAGGAVEAVRPRRDAPRGAICWSNGIARRSGSTSASTGIHAAWDAVLRRRWRPSR